MKPCRLPALRIVVLAAGFSSRMGAPKALVRLQGANLLERTLRVLVPFASGRPVIVVSPPDARRWRRGLAQGAATFIANPERALGLSSSVRIGVNAARRAAGVLLIPVDLAHLEARDVDRLIKRWRAAPRRVAARRVHDAPGTPLILPRWLFSRACTLTGDAGLRTVVCALPPARVALIELPTAAADVDTPLDLARARRRLPARRR